MVGDCNAAVSFCQKTKHAAYADSFFIRAEDFYLFNLLSSLTI